MTPEIRKLAGNGNGLKISIPRHFARALAWPLGSHIYIRVNADDTITLRRIDLPELDRFHHAAAA